MEENLVINVEDFIGKFVRLTSIVGFAVRGVIYHTKDLEALCNVTLYDYPYCIVDDEAKRVYSFGGSNVKSIEVLL